MSYILFIAAVVAGIPGAFKFNDKKNSMLAPALAAWPMSPLVVP